MKKKYSSIWYQFHFPTHLYQKMLCFCNDTERQERGEGEALTLLIQQ